MTAGTARTPADLIGVVPHTLGYTPTQSLVFIIVSDQPDGTTVSGVTVRVDFSEIHAMEAIAGNGRHIVDMLLNATDATSVFVIGFTDMPPDFLRAAVDAIARTLGDRGVETSGAWQVTGGLFFRLDDPVDPGTPMSQAGASALATQQVANGSNPVESAHNLVTKPKSDDEREAFLDGTDPLSIEEAFGVIAQIYPQLDDHRRKGEGDMPDFGENALVISTLITPQVVRALDAVLERKWSRDALEMLLAFDHPDFTPDKVRALPKGGLYDRASISGPSQTAAAQMPGLSPHRPDINGLATAIGFIQAYSLWAANAETWATAAAVIAWFHWATGGSSLAEAWSDAALDADPAQTMAELITGAVKAGYLPTWLN